MREKEKFSDSLKHLISERLKWVSDEVWQRVAELLCNPPSINSPKEKLKWGIYNRVYQYWKANPDWKPTHWVVETKWEPEWDIFSHAWLQWTDPKNEVEWVYDSSIKILIPAHIYYLDNNIEYSVEYEKDEYQALLNKTKHTGPWDECVIAFSKKI